MKLRITHKENEKKLKWLPRGEKIFCFYGLRPFLWLRRLTLRCFYAYGVSRFMVV